MDVEPANENDTSREPVGKTNISPTPDKSKETQNHKHSKPKRSSRSRTPQKKLDDLKILHVSMKRIGDEVNGKNIEEKCENGEIMKVENIESKKEENGETIKDGNSESKKEENGETQQMEHSESQEVKEAALVEVVNGKYLEAEAEEKSKDAVPQMIEAVRESISEEKNDQEKPSINDNSSRAENLNGSQKGAEEPGKQDSKETIEMDPLVISDEVDIELQFLEENSDKESGKGSPIIHRCSTRRSYTRNIPTPKTPKLSEDPESEKNSVVDHSEDNICNLPNDIPMPKTDNLNETNDSTDTTTASTKVEVGSDATRLDFTAEVNSSVEQDITHLNNLRDRGLSARRPIRGVEDYRKRVLRNAQNKSDLNVGYSQVSTGIKRKNRSLTPEEEAKKFRSDSPGYKTFFTSPLASLRNKFRSDLQSSTPELLGYKDDRRNLHFNDNLDIEKIEDAGENDKKSWCTLM